MTRSSKLAIVTLLAGLLSFTSVGSVSADNLCSAGAQEHCEQMAAADDAILFHAAIVTPVHILSGNGMGQEHFEAMTPDTVRLFTVTAPAPAATYLPNFAQEHYEEIMAATGASN